MAAEKDQCCNVVNFTIHGDKDEDGSSELLVRARDHWFYVCIDPEELVSSASGKRKRGSSALREEYEGKRDKAVKAQRWKEAEVTGEVEQGEEEEKKEEERRPGKKRKLNATPHDSGYVSSSDSKKDRRREEDTHAVNVNDNEDDDADNADDSDEEDAETHLQNWMLAPLVSHFSAITAADPISATENHPTLAEWYNAPLHCFALRASSTCFSSPPNEALEAVELPDLDEKQFRTRNLQNTLNLPKTLRKAAPWYTPDEVLVMDEAHDIHMSIHPTLVRCVTENASAGDEDYEQPIDAGTEARAATSEEEENEEKPTHFLKLVPPGGQSARHSILRELSILEKLGSLSNNHNSNNNKNHLDPQTSPTSPLRFPKLAGLISPPSTPHSHASIHGFLLELIPQPTVPLTTKMTPSVPSSKRQSWAQQARDMLQVLHANGIVWGDAKGDNFLVDGTREEKLWMIDFGGGRTEGWVQEGKCETLEGDVEGMDKIVGGVREPGGGGGGCGEGEEDGEEGEEGKEGNVGDEGGSERVEGRDDDGGERTVKRDDSGGGENEKGAEDFAEAFGGEK
ncbi:MAG: hypothetical protein M1831_003617 [Alyxoria varia]|nr:MAG: hypothetical protein M1831_003617 [Alyxoria varia]